MMNKNAEYEQSQEEELQVETGLDDSFDWTEWLY